jgi:predicted transcriptional regulator
MDIAAAMLDICKDGAIKTRIMYSAFLSYPQLKEYLRLLVDTGLLEHVKDEHVYHATDKGKKEVNKMVPRNRELL